MPPEAAHGRYAQSPAPAIAGLVGDIKFSRYDTADCLEAEADLAAYLDAVMEDGEPTLSAAELGDTARARARIAAKANSDRQPQ